MGPWPRPPRSKAPGKLRRWIPGPVADPLDAVIISDLHLGAHNCETAPLLDLLDRIERGSLSTRRLVVNGDIFDSIDFRRMRPAHWEVLAALRRLAERIEVVWLTGNHDGPAEMVSLLLGVPVLDEYLLESGGRRFLVLHGHLFDDFIRGHKTLTTLADWGYAILQRLDRSHELSRRIKRVSKIFLRYRETIVGGSIERARQAGCEGVICGHVHHAEVVTTRGVEYVNSGCWTERPPTYLTVLDGRVEIHRSAEEWGYEETAAVAGTMLQGGLLQPAGEAAV